MSNFVKIDEEIDSLTNKEISCWKNKDEKGIEIAREARGNLETQRKEMEKIHGEAPYPTTLKWMYSSVRQSI